MLQLGARALGSAVVTVGYTRRAAVCASSFHSVQFSPLVSLRALPHVGGTYLRVRSCSSLVNGGASRVQYAERAQKREEFLSQPAADVFSDLGGNKEDQARLRFFFEDNLNFNTVEDVLSCPRFVVNQTCSNTRCFAPVSAMLSKVNEVNCKQYHLEQAGKTIKVTTADFGVETFKVYSTCQLEDILKLLRVPHLVLTDSSSAHGNALRHRVANYTFLSDEALYHLPEASREDVLRNLDGWRKHRDSDTETAIQAAMAKQLHGTIIYGSSNDRSVHIRKDTASKLTSLTDLDCLIQVDGEDTIYIGEVKHCVSEDDVYQFVSKMNLLKQALASEESLVAPIELANTLKGKDIRLVIGAAHGWNRNIHELCEQLGLLQVVPAVTII